MIQYIPADATISSASVNNLATVQTATTAAPCTDCQNNAVADAKKMVKKINNGLTLWHIVLILFMVVLARKILLG